MTTQELEQKFDKFLATWNNKQVEAYDATSPFQCFDLIIKWCDELGIPRLATGGSIFPFWGAYQIYRDFQSMQSKYFTRIENTPDAVPQKGDILVWGQDLAGTGGAGHTAIASRKGTANTFEAFSQNNPKYRLSVVTNFSYYKVLGWLRYKVTNYSPLPITPPPMNADDRAYFFDLIFNSNAGFDWGTTDSKKVTKEKVAEFNQWTLNNKNGNGKWDQVNLLGWGVPVDTRKTMPQQLYDHIKGTGVDTAKIREEGRKAGVKQVQDVVAKQV